MTIQFGSQVLTEEDLIEHPNHYAKNEIEPITFIMGNDPDGMYARGAVIKYVSRAGQKSYDGMSAKQSEIADWKKAMRYCEMRIRQLEGKSVV